MRPLITRGTLIDGPALIPEDCRCDLDHPVAPWLRSGRL